jgi:hypothetical protein
LRGNPLKFTPAFNPGVQEQRVREFVKRHRLLRNGKEVLYAVVLR